MSTSHVVPLTLAACCWGVGAVISKHAVSFLAPLPLLVIQLSSSLVTMGFLARDRLRPFPARRAVALGILNPGLAYLLSLAGLVSITAGLSVTLWAFEPVLIALMAWLVLGQRLSAAAALAVIVAVVGAVVAGAGQVTGGALAGVLLTVAAVACCAIYAVAAHRWAGEASTLSIVAAQQAAAWGFAVAVWVVASLVGVGNGSVDVPITAWVSAVTSGVLYYGLAFWAFLTGLRRTTATVAGQFVNLVPVVGITAGWALLGEPVGMRQVFGGVVVVFAVAGLIATTSGVVSER